MANLFNCWRSHPWHGIDVGKNPSLQLNAYTETTPKNF